MTAVAIAQFNKNNFVSDTDSATQTQSVYVVYGTTRHGDTQRLWFRQMKKFRFVKWILSQKLFLRVTWMPERVSETNVNCPIGDVDRMLTSHINLHYRRDSWDLNKSSVQFFFSLNRNIMCCALIFIVDKTESPETVRNGKTNNFHWNKLSFDRSKVYRTIVYSKFLVNSHFISHFVHLHLLQYQPKLINDLPLDSFTLAEIPLSTKLLLRDKSVTFVSIRLSIILVCDNVICSRIEYDCIITDEIDFIIFSSSHQFLWMFSNNLWANCWLDFFPDLITNSNQKIFI